MRTITRTCLSELIMCACLLAFAWPSWAATVTVTNTNDDGAGSLRSAIATTLPGDTIEFALTYPATITLSNTLFITQNLTIHGPGPSNLAISGDRGVEAFFISPGVSAALSGLAISGSNFGTALNAGGAIYNAGTLALTNITVRGYSDVGGGIYNAGALTLTNSMVSGFATIGGGIGNVGTLNIAYSTFSGNYAVATGAGIWTSDGTVTIRNSTFSGGGTDDFSGGGITNWDGTLTLTNSTFSDNYAHGAGGGIENVGTLSITNSTFLGNHAFVGGGIENGGTLSITNSTFLGNRDFVGGGGIVSVGALKLTNSTFSGNAGGIYNGGTLIVKNTILEKNSPFGNCVGTAPISPGHNLSDDASCDFAGIGDLNNTPAGLDPGGLRYNGGPTQTIALLPSSPAVDAIPVGSIKYCTLTDGVTLVATDQRGVIRPQLQNCDIGAYEFATANSLLVALQRQIETSIAEGNRTDRRDLEEASEQLSAILAPQNWTGSDGNHIDRNNALQFFLKEEAAARDLTHVLRDKRSQIPPQEVRTDLDNLALANRLLATVAIADAAGKNPTLLSWASAELAKGDQEAAAGDYNSAIVAYARAWILAVTAL